MAIIASYGYKDINKVSIKELNWETVYRRDKKENDKKVSSFILTNDNYQNCPAHTKTLGAEEMIAIYEYMKKIMEGG